MSTLFWEDPKNTLNSLRPESFFSASARRINFLQGFRLPGAALGSGVEFFNLVTFPAHGRGSPAMSTINPMVGLARSQLTYHKSIVSTKFSSCLRVKWLLVISGYISFVPHVAPLESLFVAAVGNGKQPAAVERTRGGTLEPWQYQLWFSLAVGIDPNLAVLSM